MRFGLFDMFPFSVSSGTNSVKKTVKRSMVTNLLLLACGCGAGFGKGVMIGALQTFF
jgi:hypothetical protein